VTIGGNVAAGSGVAATSATIGSGATGCGGVAGDRDTVGGTAGASTWIEGGSASGGDGATGGGGITGTCSTLGGPCVELPSGRAWAQSAAMYCPQVAPKSPLVDGGAGPHDWISEAPLGATNIGVSAAAMRRQNTWCVGGSGSDSARFFRPQTMLCQQESVAK
jgi:hypothetical protein